ncbi:MAG: DUF1640 domain-containing protein [Leptospira sp.]|nr:DUF1640 domain-containing protein [Leptospira sp.]
MALVQKVPRKLEEVLGPEGTDQFVDFLNVSFNAQKEDIVQLITDKFGRTVTEETSKLDKKIMEETSKLDKKISEETSKLDKRITEETSKIRLEMADFRTEIKTDVANVKTDIANVKAELKSDLSTQTRWILAAILSVTVLLPFFTEVVKKLFH